MYDAKIASQVKNYEPLKMNTNFDIAFFVKNELGEGPIWDSNKNQLIWFDIIRRTLFFGNPITKTVSTIGFEMPVSAGFLTNTNILLVASSDGLLEVDQISGSYRNFVDLESQNHLTRSNDSRTAPGNSIWFGTMGRNLEKGLGAIYHIKDKKVTELFSNITVSNSICFSKNGKRAFYSDTNTNTIMKCEINEETGFPNGKSEIFVDLSSEKIRPDGSVIDENDCLWNAQWGSGKVSCYDPEGKLVKSIYLPASKITCPAFGGKDLKTLYVTSANENLSLQEKEEQPHAGAVFSIEMEYAGLPERKVIL